MTEAKLVCSPYVKVIEYKKRNLAFHTLFGNPVLIDNDTVQLLLSLKEPVSLSSLVVKGDDYFYALAHLISLGFVLKHTGKEQEFEKWKTRLQSDNNEDIFSQGVIFLLTSRCNLNCSYCICSHTSEKRQDMTSETADAILNWYLPYISKLKNNRNPLFIFTGGEPFLQISLLRNIITTIEGRIPHLHPLYRVITNGTLITKQTASYFEDHLIDLIISADSDKTIHNNNRPFVGGEPSWERIWDRMKLFSREYIGKNISVSSVFHEDTPAGNWNELLDMLYKTGIMFWTLNIDNLIELKNPEKTAEIIIQLRKTAKTKYGILVSGRWATPAANIRAGNGFNAVCSASGRNRIFFQPDGSVTFCDYDPRKLGSIYSIEDYLNWANAHRDQYFFYNWKECHTCMLSGFCSPCVLEEEVLHPENSRYREQKCKFIRACTKLLLFEQEL